MPAFSVARGDYTFVDAEGVTIHYYEWRAGTPKAVVHLIHGLGEYATRYEGFAQALVAAGYSVYAGDLRGHGQTGVQQWGGDITKLGKLGPGGVRATLAGVRKLSGIARSAHPDLPLVLLGHSLGSIFAQMILNQNGGEGASDYDAAVLSGTPYRTVLRMNSGPLNKRFRHLGTTGAEWLSRDPAVAPAFIADPLTDAPRQEHPAADPDRQRGLARWPQERRVVGGRVSRQGRLDGCHGRHLRGRPARGLQRDQSRRGDRRPHGLARCPCWSPALGSVREVASNYAW